MRDAFEVGIWSFRKREGTHRVPRLFPEEERLAGLKARPEKRRHRDGRRRQAEEATEPCFPSAGARPTGPGRQAEEVTEHLAFPAPVLGSSFTVSLTSRKRCSYCRKTRRRVPPAQAQHADNIERHRRATRGPPGTSEP